MNKILQISFMAALVCLTPSCGTLERGDIKEGGGTSPMPFADQKIAYYPATKYDASLLEIGDVFVIIDFPISVVTDTLFLPYDIATDK